MRDNFTKPRSNKQEKRIRLKSLKEASGYKGIKSIKELSVKDAYPNVIHDIFLRRIVNVFNKLFE